MTQPIDRKPIFISLINSYLPQLTEADLYKLHDIVRNTAANRTSVDAPKAVGSTEGLRLLAAKERQDAFNKMAPFVDPEGFELGRNTILYSSEFNLPADTPDSKSLIGQHANAIEAVKMEIDRLRLNTAPYGVLTSAWRGHCTDGVGVDVFFGVNGVFDGKVRLNFTDKTVYVIAEDRRPGTPVDVRSFNAASPFTRSGLFKGLQSLASQYKMVLNKQPS